MPPGDEFLVMLLTAAMAARLTTRLPNVAVAAALTAYADVEKGVAHYRCRLT
jgi:hypothetical protein